MIIKLFTVFSVKVFGAISTLAMSILITNITDLGTSGVFFTYLMFVFSLGSILTLGSPILINKYIPIYYKKSNFFEISKTILTLLLFYVLMFVIVICVSYIISLSVEYTLVVVSTILFSLLQCMSSLFQGVFRPVLTVFFQNVITPFLCSILVVFYFVFGEINSFNLILCYSISVFISCLLGVVLLKPALNITTYKFNVYNISSVKLVLPVALITCAIQLNQWLTQYSVSYFLSYDDMALFSPVQRLAVVISFTMVIVNHIYSPRIVLCESSLDLDRLCKRISTINLIIGMPILIFVVFFSKNILSFFGEGYDVSSVPLIILCAGQFVNLITGPVFDVLYVKGYENDAINTLVLTLYLTAFLSFVLVPLFGLVGGAISIALPMAFQNILNCYKVKDRLGFNPLFIFRGYT